ncbi:5553_t:CDS:1, partial [Racocetra persica]
ILQCLDEDFDSILEFIYNIKKENKSEPPKFNKQPIEFINSLDDNEKDDIIKLLKI